MSVLITGSVAIDHIMVFQDQFENHILSDKVHAINVSFFIPGLEKRYGGTGANIAYNTRRLGLDPILLATVGSDFGDYAEWMDRHGIRRNWIKTIPSRYTAQAFITTDLSNNQITSFHAGAMEVAHEASLDEVEEEVTVGIVAPNGQQAMVEYCRGLKQRGVPVVVDPGQAMPIVSKDDLIEMIEGSHLYVVNDYEWALTREKTGLDEDGVAERVGALVVTRGAEGSLVRRGGLEGSPATEQRSEIPAVRAENVVDPTGAGDAYRAGLLYAVVHGLPLETGARIGGVLGALKVALPGPQSLDCGLAEIRERYEREYGEGF